MTNLKELNHRFGFPEVLVNRLCQWFISRPYNQRDFILPEYLSDDLNDIDYDTARKLMYCSVKVGALQQNYEIYCPRCHERILVVSSQDQIPHELSCDNYSCGYKFNPWEHLDHIVVSFKIN